MPQTDSFKLDTPPEGATVAQAPQSELVQAELVQAELADAMPPPPPRRRRRILLPLVLFLLTCASTFLAGATGWMPFEHIVLLGNWSNSPGPTFQLQTRLAILENWRDGLIYMGCVLAILLTHEMGHFVMTVIYRVRASLPLFVPLPISAIGTMGAVIAMDGSKADRKQIFDIGLAGPLAGLVVAAPLIWIGTAQLDLATPGLGLKFGQPLVVQWLIEYLHPESFQPNMGVAISQLNPFFMAGWVGLLVTGLNMMPVGQLDGGHITYALFGRLAHWLARLFMIGVCVYMAAMWWFYNVQPMWILMVLLVLLIGTDHPPTRDDTVPLGWFRIALGALSLLIPVFCFAPNLIRLP